MNTNFLMAWGENLEHAERAVSDLANALRQAGASDVKVLGPATSERLTASVFNPAATGQERADQFAVACFVGHGGTRSIVVPGGESSYLQWRWGDGALRQVLLMACNVMEGDGGPAILDAWRRVFCGVRLVLGVTTPFWIGSDTGQVIFHQLSKAPSVIEGWFDFLSGGSRGQLPAVLAASELCLGDSFGLVKPDEHTRVKPDTMVLLVEKKGNAVMRPVVPWEDELPVYSVAGNSDAAEAHLRKFCERIGMAVSEKSLSMPGVSELSARSKESLAELVRQVLAAPEDADGAAADHLEAESAPFLSMFSGLFGLDRGATVTSSTHCWSEGHSHVVMQHADHLLSQDRIPLAGPGAFARVSWRHNDPKRVVYRNRHLVFKELRARVSENEAKALVEDAYPGFQVTPWPNGPTLALWLARPDAPQDVVIPFYAFQCVKDSQYVLVLTAAIRLLSGEERWIEPIARDATIVPHYTGDSPMAVKKKNKSRDPRPDATGHDSAAWKEDAHDRGVEYWCQRGTADHKPGLNSVLAGFYKTAFGQSEVGYPTFDLLRKLQILLGKSTFVPSELDCKVGEGVEDPDSPGKMVDSALRWVDFLNSFLARDRYCGAGFALSFHQYVILHKLLRVQADLMLISPYTDDAHKTLPTTPDGNGNCKVPAFW